MENNSGISMRKIPPGILVIRRIRGQDWNLTTYRYVVLVVTFIAYACYHASRKPSSIVKSVLDPESNHHHLHYPPRNYDYYPWPVGKLFVKQESITGVELRDDKGWYPFNTRDGKSKLGEIDVAFLSCYALGMYVAGHLGDTLDLRLFLTFGMIGSGIFVGLFGMGFIWNIHLFWFYLSMQMLAGLFQATGWPSVVAVVGNWCGNRKRGLIMGVWNAHTSIGNIAGSLLAAAVLDYGWGWSFIAPGVLIILGGLLVFLYLAPYPEDVGFPGANINDEEAQVAVAEPVGSASRGSVGLVQAFLIPGVIPFALCLFFSKLVAYTFLYWLPFYLSQTTIGGEYISVKSAGNLSTLFDLGGIFGGVIAGYVSDRFKARATTAATFLYAAIPFLMLYSLYGHISETLNIVLMMFCGLFVNGPYALITTAVSADLGTHRSLRGNSRALATVTAIIDGTGSIGAAIGPLITGFLSTKGWDAVFFMLVICALIAGLLLSRLVMEEFTTQRPVVTDSGDEAAHEDSESQSLLINER